MPSSRDPEVTYRLRPMEADDERTLLARRLPKAEMHMHHMGSLSPAQLAHLHKQWTGSALGARDADAAYDNRGVGKFFDDLDKAVRLWKDEAALVAGALHMIYAAYDRGVRHLELLCTPDLHRQQLGMEPEEMLRGVGRAFEIAGDELGLTGGIVVELHRFDGGDAAVALVEETAPLREKGIPVLGYGNDGDHRTVPFAELAPAYELARAEGFPLTGHADVFEDVVAALDLGLDRIDHGWMAADDPAVLDRLASAGAPMTFTPMGYALGGLRSNRTYVEAYQALTAAGVVIALGTDDPELHHTDIAGSYEMMARKLDWTSAEMGAAAKASFAAAWLPEGEAEQVRARWSVEIDALVGDPRSPVRDGEPA
jgi:adenosine deaminase